jgi:aspartate 1-decarboxylase
MALNDRELLARTLQAEAGNQGFGGMIAAGSVIMNRLGSNGSLRNVILKPGQFSAWNSVTGYAGGEQGQNMDFTPSAEAYKAADALLSGKYQDPTGGATHYYNPSISTPSWGQEAGGQWTKIGAHLFGTPSGEKRKTTPRANAREVSPMDGQQPMQQQMPQQGPQGLMGFLRDPRTRQVLSAFSRSGVGQRLGQIAAQDLQRQEQQQTANRTAQWLASQPNGQKYADLVLSGTLSGSEAYNAWQQENAGVTGVKVGDKLVNPQTGEIIFEDSAAAEELTNEQVGIVRNLSNDLLKTYKIYDEVANGYGLISSAIKNKTGVDDYVITVAFAKILDPESVVRESEQAAVAKSGGAIDAFVKDVQNFISGTGSLPDTVKNRIFETAKQRADFYFNKAQQEHTRAITIARSAGIPTDLIDKVVPKPTPMPKITPIVAPSGEEDTRTQAAKDAGITIEMWNDMLPEEKRPFE